MLGKLSRYVGRLGAFLITAALIAGMAGCDGYNPGPSQNLEIRTWYDLNAVRNNLCGRHILMNDLDSSTLGYTELASPTANGGKGWDPIGTFVTNYGYRGFDGILDGQGYEIHDLFINRPDEDAVGLFCHVGVGVIKNIGVVNVTVIGRMRVGGLVGLKGDGNVRNSYATGSVSGWRDVGGLVGLNGAGNVSNSYSTGIVTGVGHVGGLVGWNNRGTVSNSFWDTQTSGQSTSDGGTGKTTAEMRETATFSGADWNIIAVAPGERNPSYIWNIVDGQTYPFLSWQLV